MKKVLLALTALSLSAAVSGCGMYDDKNDTAHREWVHNDHMQKMAQDFFNDMDTNGDGVVTKREYNDYTKEWFREADTNHDGKLTVEEVKAQMKREKEKMKAEDRAQ